MAAASASPATRVAFRTDLTERRFKEAERLLLAKADTSALDSFILEVQSTQEEVDALSGTLQKSQATEKLIAKIDEYQTKLTVIATQTQQKSLTPQTVPATIPFSAQRSAAPTIPPQSQPQEQPTVFNQQTNGQSGQTQTAGSSGQTPSSRPQTVSQSIENTKTELERIKKDLEEKKREREERKPFDSFDFTQDKKEKKEEKEKRPERNDKNPQKD